MVFGYNFPTTLTEVKMFSDLLWMRLKYNYFSFTNIKGGFISPEPLNEIREIMVNFLIYIF